MGTCNGPVWREWTAFDYRNESFHGENARRARQAQDRESGSDPVIGGYFASAALGTDFLPTAMAMSILDHDK